MFGSVGLNPEASHGVCLAVLDPRKKTQTAETQHMPDVERTHGREDRPTEHTLIHLLSIQKVSQERPAPGSKQIGLEWSMKKIGEAKTQSNEKEVVLEAALRRRAEVQGVLLTALERTR